MSNLFTVKVNDSEAFEITSEALENLNSIAIAPSKFHILQDNTPYKAEITQADFSNKTYQVKVNNNNYNISIFNDLDNSIKKMGFEIGASKIINEIKAPMPGLILDITIASGQDVKENDPLLILEAMKMENIIVSPRDGVIKSISVSKGEAVDKNELLVTFE